MFKWVRIVRRRIRRRPRPGIRARREGLLRYGEEARGLALSRLEYFNQFYNFKYGTVRIKAQTTRWGSCSSKGNLNFNYKMALLPPHLVDYLVVHELCHLGEFNHSQNFWDLVGKTIPNYLELRAELKSFKFH
ncbi:MAG: M48 family metallopeptidase [bacterium]